MASLGHPILGDPVYGRNSGPGDFTLLLHARKILIRLPGEEDFGLYRALLPLHFKRALLELRR
jgi:23S rRNA pseudouridine1911/1915/1917 synthase